jgi:hypothetical protein
MSSSLPQTATNSQSLNGIITLSDGVVTIEDGVISGLTELELTDLQVSDTATIENLVVNNQIDMTSGRILNLENGSLGTDAVNKNQLDLKADTSYVDGNFLNKVTATTQNVNADINMNTKKITGLAIGSNGTDAVNKNQLDLKSDISYLDGNFVNKVTNTTQSIAAKLSLSNVTTDIFTNPIIQFTNTNITPINQGQFIRFLKAVSQQANLEIGGLSFCSNDYSNTLRRQADLICSMNSNTLPEINLKFNNGTINPLTINYGQFISRNNKQYFQKQDGTNIFNYIDTLDYVAFSKEISLGSNKIINLAAPTDDGDAVNKQFLDTNFLNKTTGTTQNVASRLTFNNTTSGFSNPIIQLTNAITGSNKGMHLQFFKNFNRLPNTEIGSIVFADKDAITSGTSRAVQLTASIDSVSNPLLNITFDSGDFNPLTISTTQTILRNDDFYIINKTTAQHVFTYFNATDKFTMSKELDMTTNDITNVNSITADGNINTTANMSCVDFNSGGNQILGTNSSDSLNVKSSSFFESDVLIESNKHIGFYNSDLTADSGVKMYFDRSIGSLGRFYMDMRGSEIQIRTDASSEPTSERVKINNSETTINNNLIANGNVNLGNNPTVDTTTINSVATFNGTTTFNSETTINNNLIANGNVNLGNNPTVDTTTINSVSTFNGTATFNSETTINNNLLCNGNNTLGNSTTGDSTTVNSVATFNGTTTFNDNTTFNSISTYNGTTTFNNDVLIEGTNKLTFNNDDLTSANGMLMRHNGLVGFLDVRGNEFRIRTSSTGTPNTIRFKVNDENTTVINNFFVDGSTTLGNDIGNDTTVFNSKANFPSGSELKFNANSALIFQTGSSTTFASGSNTNFQDGANLTFSSNSLYLSEADIQYYNVQIFQPGSYIDGARINLISKTSDFTLNYLSNFENGCICNHTSGTLNITMPNTGGASGQYWRRRNYIIKVRETTVKLKQNTTTLNTKIDELTGDVNYTTDYKTINLVFDENYHENGQIWIISDR